jgi:NADH dehydrogenase
MTGVVRDGPRSVADVANKLGPLASFKALCARLDGLPLGLFQYRDHGSLVSLGSSTAVGSLAGLSRGGKIFVKGYVAEFIYAALYRKHLMAVSGVRRAAFAIAAHKLSRMLSPRVKLH